MTQEYDEGRTRGIRNVDLGRAAALAAGALSAVAVDNLARQKFGRARTELAAVGLITAAAIYPLARKEARAGLAAAREVAGVWPPPRWSSRLQTPPGLRRRAVLGAAWAGHALFDNVHDSSRAGGCRPGTRTCAPGTTSPSREPSCVHEHLHPRAPRVGPALTPVAYRRELRRLPPAAPAARAEPARDRLRPGHDHP